MLFQVEVDDLFAFGGVDLVHFGCEFEGIGSFMCVFSSIHLLGGRDVMFRKKLLRFSAGLSTGAVVAPIDRVRHGCLSE